MSMLAGPKYKQKISVDPRNKAWSKDSSKFGQKMLEKMGWQEGRGLGANEDGSQTHVKVSLKNNTLGLGCTPSYEDNWIAHQDDFNDILQSLNQNHSSGEGGSEPPSGTITPLSLEECSKKSRSRVHYKRFTKGKDLSSRRRDDLDSIFGKRGSKSAPTSPQNASEANSAENSDVEEGVDHGVVTITNKSSIQDYFAQKMAKLQAERTAAIIQDAENNTEESEENVEEVSLKKRKKKKQKKEKGKISANEVVNFTESEGILKQFLDNHENGTNKMEGILVANGNGDPMGNNAEGEQRKKRKKNKKKKKDQEINEDAAGGDGSKAGMENENIDGRKWAKRKANVDSNELDFHDGQSAGEGVQKRKSKKKKKNLSHIQG